MFCFVRDINILFELSNSGAVVFDSLSQLGDEQKRLMAQSKLA